MKPGEWGTRGGASREHLIDTDGLSVCGRRGPFEPFDAATRFLAAWRCPECVEIAEAREIPPPPRTAPDPVEARRARAAAAI